jgi:hypothetical protein
MHALETNMAVLLTANKSFRLSGEPALALERLAVFNRTNQTQLLDLPLVHFEQAELARMTPEEQEQYRAGRLSHTDLKGIHRRRKEAAAPSADPAGEPPADLNFQGMAALGELITLRR